MSHIELGNTVGETVGNSIGVDEEYWQAIDPNANDRARTSSFSPEDLLSNNLGLIFSRYDDNGDFEKDLAGFLNEAATLFSTNVLIDGKYITNSDVSRLRSLISKYHDTDDFTDFQKGNAMYNLSEIKQNASNRAAELNERPVYKAYLENIYSNIK